MFFRSWKGIQVEHYHIDSHVKEYTMCARTFSLFRPLADSEKLPVRSHRAVEAAKSPAEDGETENAASQEPKKKNNKEKREKKKDKDRDRKVNTIYLFDYLLCLLK